MKLFYLFTLLVLSPMALPAAQNKTTYADHVLPLIENHCGKCHNPDKKKGDLDLTTYPGVLKGGGSGPVVIAGNPDSSKLWKAITQVEDPTMPPNKPPLPDKELAVFKQWIAGGLLETAGSKAIAASKPTVDLSLKIASVGKPAGPPPMPGDLSLEIVVHTARGNPINGLAASPWAPVAAIAGQKQILLYHSTRLELLGILPFPEGQPWDLKFSRSGKLLLAGGGHGAKSGKVVVWNIETGERVISVGSEYDIVLAADLSPDQARVALGGPDRLIKIYATRDGDLEHKIKKHTDWITALAFSPNGEFLVSGDRNGSVSLWDPDNGQELFTTAGHKGAITAAAWRGDSKVVATSSEDGSVKLWETSEGKQAKTWVAHAAGALGVAYAQDGQLVTAGREGTLIVWNADGTKRKTLEMGREPAVRCAFTADGTRVLGADFAGRVALWDVKEGKLAGDLDANPLPLADRLEAARRRLASFPADILAPSPEAARLSDEWRTKTNEVALAGKAAAQAQAGFDTRSREVVRLKNLAAAPGKSADISGELASARAAREKLRTLLTNAVALLTEKQGQLVKIQEELQGTTRAQDARAEQAAALALVNRLTVAQSLAELSRARETVALQKRGLDRNQALVVAKEEEIQTLTRDLGAARDSSTKSRLKTALKSAVADATAAHAEAKSAATAFDTAQRRLEQVTREHEQRKTASAKPQPPTGS